MAHRIELSNIATGVLGSFVSRHNDIGGYWALGLLDREALSSGRAKTTLELLAEDKTNESPLIKAVRSKYREMKLAIMQRRDLSGA